MKPIMFAVPDGDIDDPNFITVVEVEYPTLIAINSMTFEDWAQVVEFFSGLDRIILDNKGGPVPTMGSTVSIPMLGLVG